MPTLLPAKLLIAAVLLNPAASLAQGGGGAGGGSAGGSSAGSASPGGAASGPSVGTGSAVGSPNAGSAGAGTQGLSGVPSGPANPAGLNNSGNDPSGAGNSAKVAAPPPGTNTLGTANSTGSGATTGTAGGRIDGTVTPGPSMPGDAEIRAEDPKVDAKIKSICRGC
jgi:hypothetical protein